jgi:hypothetical protein
MPCRPVSHSRSPAKKCEEHRRRVLGE